MFNGFEQLSIAGQFQRLALPRGDWFDSPTIQKFLVQVNGEFEQLGHALPGGDELINICRAGQLDQHVTQTQCSTGISGLKTEHPQHAGVVELGRWDSIDERRLRLAAFVMICVDDWRERLTDTDSFSQKTEIFERRLGEVWRMLRLASTAAFSLIPPINMNVDRFHDELEDAMELLDPRDKAVWGRDLDYLRLLLRFVNYYLGGGKVYQRLRPGAGQSETKLETGQICISPMDGESEIQAQSSADETLVTRETLSEIRKSDHFQCGNAPEEIESGPRLSQSIRSISLAQGGSPAQAVIRLKRRQIHQRRHAQLLPGRWSVLNDFELRMLGLSLQLDEGELGTTVATALWLMLLTGRELATVLTARVVRRVEQVPKNLDGNSLYLVADASEWVADVMRPEHRRKTRKAWQGVLQQHEDRLYLPVPAMIWASIGPFINSRGRHSRERSAALFPGSDVSRVERLLRDFLSRLNRKEKIRLTLARIAYQLSEETHRVSGDLIESSLLTGRQPPFGTSAAVYYHHRDRQALMDHYTAVTDRWERIIFTSRLATPGYQKTLIDGAVGSDLVLRTDVVQDLFRALSRQVEYDRSLLGTLEGLRTFHNALTDYVVMMTLWFTGYRAVQDPLSQASDFNARRGFLVVADKTGDGYGHSRMVPVCRVLADQLLAYQSHTGWLTNRLSLVGRRSQGTSFFYLDDDLHELQVRPTSMSRFLEWAYVLPLNLNRHWLRGVLRERRVPGPHVDRFMGHWSMGQEPWGRFSGVDPQEFQRTLQDALDRMADILHLEVLEGLA